MFWVIAYLVVALMWFGGVAQTGEIINYDGDEFRLRLLITAGIGLFWPITLPIAIGMAMAAR